MKIVLYEINDASQVASFFREIFTELGFDERPTDYIDQPHQLFRLPEGGMLLLVKEKGNIIGTAGIILLTKTDGLIKRFYIKKQYRGTGVAQQLLNELIKIAKGMKVKKLILDVSKNNPQGWRESYEPEAHYYFYKKI